MALSTVACGRTPIEDDGPADAFPAADATQDAIADRDAPEDRDAPADRHETGDREDDGAAHPDAAISDASCLDLQTQAAAAIEPIVRANLGCTTDEDCAPTFIATCAFSCGVVTNTAGLTAVFDAVSTLCPPYRARGCTGTTFTCPSIDPVVCTGGECASAEDFTLSDPTPSLAHGMCSTMTLAYSNYLDTSAATHTVSLAATNGALYMDAACTHPLTGGVATFPNATRSIVLGFVPAAPGGCTITVGGLANARTTT
jgi:hypothetical protein